MSREFKVSGFAYSERFKTEMQDAKPDVHRAASSALALLQTNPKAKSLRLHNLSGYPKPTIWKIDVFANRSWQITFEIVDEIAHLKRISTHRSIDRAPRKQTLLKGNAACQAFLQIPPPAPPPAHLPAPPVRRPPLPRLLRLMI